jgi:hypothetical protein
MKHHSVLASLEEERRQIRMKEEDFNNEVQQMIITIDEHAKLNAKVVKHYEKRLIIIEKDLMQLQKMSYGSGVT